MLGFAVRFLVSGGLIAFLLTTVDFAQVVEQFRSLAPHWLAAALAIEALLTLIAAQRWRMVLAVVTSPVSLSDAIRNFWIGLFFNQTLPSSVGGDAMRMYEARRLGIPLRFSISSVLIDRLLGLAAVLLLLALALPFYFGLVPELAMAWALVALATLGIAGLVVLVVFARLRPRWLRGKLFDMVEALSRDCSALTSRRPVAGATLAMAVVMQFGGSVLVWVLAKALAIAIAPGEVLLLMLPVTLFIMLPISIAGWGTREGAFVVAFGLLDVAAPQALGLSVLYGLLIAAFALPGGAIWLLAKRRPVPEPKADARAT